MSLMGAKEIMEIIPHRQPFMLIDTIEELEEGFSAGTGDAGCADCGGACADGRGSDFKPAGI